MTAEGYMYCPRCGAEYRPSFVACADCNVGLVTYQPSLPRATRGQAADGGEAEAYEGRIVELTRVSSRFEADVIVAKLRSAEIPVTMHAADADGWYPHLGFVEGYRVMVTAQDLDEARQALTRPHGPVRRRRRSST